MVLCAYVNDGNVFFFSFCGCACMMIVHICTHNMSIRFFGEDGRDQHLWYRWPHKWRANFSNSQIIDHYYMPSTQVTPIARQFVMIQNDYSLSFRHFSHFFSIHSCHSFLFILLTHFNSYFALVSIHTSHPIFAHFNKTHTIFDMRFTFGVPISTLIWKCLTNISQWTFKWVVLNWTEFHLRLISIC